MKILPNQFPSPRFAILAIAYVSTEALAYRSAVHAGGFIGAGACRGSTCTAAIIEICLIVLSF
jgi:hypothetical protein